jgi:hypothetical protein
VVNADLIPFLVAGAISAAIFLKILHSWYKDYQFYSANHWDYSKDSGRELRWGVANVKLGRMSNRDKMESGYRRGAIAFFLGTLFFWSPVFLI